MKEAFPRYQVFIGLLIGSLIGSLVISSAIIFVTGHKAPVMAPPAYAAAGDVYGSPNVTVAAFRVRIPLGPGNSRPILLLVKADGILTTTALPPNVTNFLDDDIDALSNSTSPIQLVLGSDRKMYYRESFSKTWLPLTTNSLP